MNKLVYFSLLIISMQVGCMAPDTLSTPLFQEPTPTQSVSLQATVDVTITPTAQPSPSLTPIRIEPTATNTSSLSLTGNMRYKPLEISPKPGTEAVLPGTVVILGDPPYLLNFARGMRQDLPDETLCFSTSPDRKWFAYCKYEEELLIVQSDIEQQVITLPIEKDWWLFGTSTWLDSQRLIFNLRWQDESEAKSIRPVITVNPFTGETQELASDYPDLVATGGGPGGSALDFVSSTVVYHPSLKLVIYPRTTQAGPSVVLWDREMQQTLAAINLQGFAHTPLWAPDGEQFVIAGAHQPAKPEGGFIDDWFWVTVSGEVQQLTHFGDSFDRVQIDHANWSPDGQQLAFWLATWPSECGTGQYLAVLEMDIRQVVNYCVPGSVQFDAYPPIWSPDGKYIAVGSYDGNSRQVIILFPEEGWAAQISDDVAPVGWLSSP